MDTVNLSAAPARSGNSAADARERARAFLDGLLPPVTSEAAGTVLLVVSELVTNALRHAGGTWSLELTAHPDGIEVAVHDPSPQAPRPRTPDLNGRTGGFGWPLVTRLARTTAITPGPSGGKRVSALLPR
ncbi:MULTISPECIES: ATP-binding protein [Streptomyces]|uniref:ATP-binding protein n=5 Tax=Streptomyces TaxID=1883 RepID=L8F0X1_STRR1|nr:ATP-binding protein [Streptomyces rimosus]MYT42226.1 ATP-binding protein [Streptomyces sp. SID5471]QDA09108.1 ATP-binding protein [Streptomyces rimosus]QEV80386.1 ATP-binding protein [Streptomyces rimosus]QST78848.1 ATP-binding protein [Streptomyces rimosus subsp. rimosus ATCC 10970]UNZ08497.1 hypothetical protein SRIMR7_40740 [Streptomyces rimosus subsp. rimosus]